MPHPWGSAQPKGHGGAFAHTQCQGRFSDFGLCTCFGLEPCGTFMHVQKGRGGGGSRQGVKIQIKYVVKKNGVHW